MSDSPSLIWEMVDNPPLRGQYLTTGIAVSHRSATIASSYRGELSVACLRVAGSGRPRCRYASRSAANVSDVAEG